MNILLVLVVFIKVTLVMGGESVSGDENTEMTNLHKDSGFRGAGFEGRCEEGPCVRKCCPESKIVARSHDPPCKTAANSSELWTPTFYDSSDFSPVASPPDDLKLVIGLLQCDSYVLDPHLNAEDYFMLLDNGHLHVPSLQDDYPPDQYCVDNFVGINNWTYTAALVCFQENVAEIKCNTAKSYVFPVLLLVSCVFLAATLVAYVSVADLRRKLNGKCLISLVAALLVAYVSLASTSLARKIPEVPCRILASLTHLTLLASFFWLNVMCFDIWRTLSQMRTAAGSRHWVRRRFLLYSLYSWGCPLVVTVAAIVVESLPASYEILRPDFASDFCWFSSKQSKWAYFYGLVLILVLTNVLFFALVAVLLLKSQENSMLNRSREVNRERLWLCIKLFLVMGVCWLAEVVSFQEGSCQAWILTDIINSLQGVSIFIVFVCNSTTLGKVRDEWGRCCGGVGGKSVLSPSTTFSLVSSRSQGSSTHSRTPSAKDSPKIKSQPEEALPLNTVKEASP